MHKEFRQLLDKATGKSEHITAIVLDIRGFSDFCQKTDSFDVANYIKTIYTKIIDNYFSNASYYKPTGDGLLVILTVPNEDIPEFTIEAIKKCLELLEYFPKICDETPMINFDTPSRIGIGVARGSACKISSETKTVDYSGRIINLAARLMGLARPSGVVMDSKSIFGKLPKDLNEIFAVDKVYVPGIAEEAPIEVYYTKQHTIIPKSKKKPLKEPTWETTEYKMRVADIFAKPGSVVSFKLKNRPIDQEQITITIDHKYAKIHSNVFRISTKNTGIHYQVIGTKAYIDIDLPVLKLNLIERMGLKETDKVRFRFVYPVS